jgi:predicted nucleic-acid-binding protein
MNRELVDTNVIIRHLVQDNARQAAVAGALFARCDRGECAVVILPAVVAECVFVLESFYGHPRGKIAEAMAGMISSPGVELADLQTHHHALNLYSRSKLHFVDCLIAAHAAANGLPVATFDRELLKITGKTP